MRVTVGELRRIVKEATLADAQKNEKWLELIDVAWEELWTIFDELANVPLVKIFKDITHNDTDFVSYKQNPSIFLEFEYAVTRIYENIKFHESPEEADFDSSEDFAETLTGSIDSAITQLLTKLFERIDSDETPESVESWLHLTTRTQVNFIKTTIKQLQKIVEAQLAIANAPPEATDPDAPWGKYAFGDSRTDTPFEPNTKEEKKSKDNLANHFDGTVLNAAEAEELKNFVDAGQYTKILEFPAEKYDLIYRGMALEESVLESLLNSDEGERVVNLKSYEVGDTGRFAFTGFARPRRETASWTVDESIAHKFARISYDDNMYNSHARVYLVVITAKVADNANKLVLNPQNIYKVKEFSNYRREQEVIGIGPIKVSTLNIHRAQ